MKRIPITVVAAIFLGTTIKAQDPWTFKTISANADIGFYLFNHWVSGIQINGLAQAQLPVAGKFSMTATTGISFSPAKAYYRESLKDYYGFSTGMYLPVWIGGRYYIVKGLHGDLELGADIKLNRLAASQFHFSPGVGYALATGGGFLNLSTHYVTGFKSGSSSFDLRIGYMFPIGQ